VRQRTLSFPHSPDYSTNAYVVGESNIKILQWFNSIDSWPKVVLGGIIVGADKAGKTHLCHVLHEKYPDSVYLNGHVCSQHHPFDYNDAPIYIIDDADALPESWLFHFYNHVLSCQKKLILTINKPISDWCSLKDLLSRLSTLPSFTLEWPDESMMYLLIKKKLTDLGIHVDEGPLHYLSQRLDRTFTAIDECVKCIDTLSAEQKRNVTLPFVRSVFA
jgi:chromosomal replication initiation ATPase DnaA